MPIELEEQKKTLKQIQHGIVNDLLKLKMLQSLYFTNLEAHVNRIADAGQRSIGSREYSDRKGPTMVQPLIYLEYFNKLAQDSNEMLRYVNIEYATLTKTPTSFFQSWLSE